MRPCPLRTTSYPKEGAELAKRLPQPDWLSHCKLRPFVGATQVWIRCDLDVRRNLLQFALKQQETIVE